MRSSGSVENIRRISLARDFVEPSLCLFVTNRDGITYNRDQSLLNAAANLAGSTREELEYIISVCDPFHIRRKRLTLARACLW
jgi:hypothetical protein